MKRRKMFKISAAVASCMILPVLPMQSQIPDFNEEDVLKAVMALMINNLENIVPDRSLRRRLISDYISPASKMIKEIQKDGYRISYLNVHQSTISLAITDHETKLYIS